MENCNPKCDLVFKNQCTSVYGSYACRLRYFNDRCLMKLRENEKQKYKKNKERECER